MTTVLFIVMTAVLVTVVINNAIQRRINAAHQRCIDAHIEALTAINRTLGNHQRALDTLRGIRR